MENHQIEFIRKNKTSLAEKIECSNKIIELLVEKDILSQIEKQVLYAETIPFSRATHLLDLLVTRKNSYQELTNILNTQNQSGAVELLELIEPTASSPTPQKLAENLEDWLKNPHLYTHDFLLFSHNVDYSKNWVSISVASCSTLEHSENLQRSGIHFSTIFPEQFSGYFGNLNCRFLVICNHKEKDNITFPDTMSCAEDRVRWNDLTSDTQDLLLKQEILFQNQKMSLSFICEFILSLRNKPDSEYNILDKLDSTLLVELVSRMHTATQPVPQLADGNIPKISKYYINRSLRPRHRIARVVLSETRNQPKGFGDIFVIKCDGLRLYQFQSFVDKYGNKQCDLWSNQIKLANINVNAILLDTTYYDFDRICEKSGKRPVHLLEGFADETKQISELFWIRSKGSMQTVQKYVHRRQTAVDEKLLHGDGNISNSTTAVCIADTAGKGKTHLLTYLAKNLQLSVFNTTQKELVYVNYATMHELLLDFTDKADSDGDIEEDDIFSEYGATYSTSDKSKSPVERQNSLKHYPDDIIKALIQRSSKYLFGRELVTALLSKQAKSNDTSLGGRLGLKVKLELIFDGIDELDTAAQQDGIQLVRVIQQKTKFIFPMRLWTATRPHLLGQMEDYLETLGYEICPFSKEYQIELLTSIWIKNTRESDESSRESMKSVATETLEKLHETFSQPDEGQNVTGLPLLFDLLAKAFKNEAREISKHNQEERNSKRRITDLTIANIYKKFIETKFECDDDKQYYLCHMEKALKFIFERRYEPGVLQPLEFVHDQKLFSFGIVETGSLMQPIKFIHSTFASYFAAQAMLKIIINLQSWDSKTQTASALKANFGMFRRILSVEEASITLSKSEKTPFRIKAYKFKYRDICYFLNFSINFDVNVKSILELPGAYPGFSSGVGTPFVREFSCDGVYI